MPGRSFGDDGNLTLTSTGGLVRILFGISTGGNLTLIGSTAGINLNSGAGAKTLSGGTVTISGNARSNRALTLTATSGALTLSGAIALTGTRVLSLSGSGGIALGGALTLTTGDSITLSSAVITGTANASLTIITTSSALTLNNNITLSGTGILDLRSGQGALTGSRPPDARRRCVSRKLMCSVTRSRRLTSAAPARWSSPPTRRKTCSIG